MCRQIAVALVLTAAIGLVAACTPTLGGDGFYRCSRVGRCPTTAPYCHPDGFCRALPSAGDAGTDTGSEDAGWANPYLECTDRCVATDEQCFAFAIPDFGAAGYCTRACTTDAECPPYLGAQSACGPTGVCVRGCTGAADCADPFECVSGRWSEAGPLTAACVGLNLYAPLSQYEACTTDARCERPLECIDGHCLRHCGAESSCSLLEICFPTAMNGDVCLFECGLTPEDCDTATSATCVGSVCRPMSW